MRIISPIAMAGNADAGSSARRYRRHRPESTLLYQLIAKYYPAFKERMLGEGRALPGYVQREFDDYLRNIPEYPCPSRTPVAVGEKIV